MTSPIRPFADAVTAYAQAGWPCILPVPPEKSPPPVGFTGETGADTDALQLATWAGTHAASSIALRMPDGVIGIDVDNYEKHGVQKHGARTFAEATERWGQLPATWLSTARDPEQGGIAFFRVPAGRYATKLEGGDVEIIQRHHRYAVVWPSPHLDAGTYTWYDPTGKPSATPPKPDEFPLLPQAWVDGLREGATDASPSAASRDLGERLLAELLADDRDACSDITHATDAAVEEVAKVDAGSRHDTMIGRVHHLVHLGTAGHPGVGPALRYLEAVWDALTPDEDRAEEFQRMMLTSARKAVTAISAAQVSNDPCALTGGLELAARALQEGPAPVDDRPDSTEPPEPIQPRHELHPLSVIGAHPFDPRGSLDQTMATAVLERMYPALRFAYDTQTWIRRQHAVWESASDLAEWSVAQLADLMPPGKPEAEKGSDARDQAERRKRFMSAGPSSALAKKMRALVAGGGHPSALRMVDMDTEPWLLWAGGVGWDIGASLVTPTPAIIDPATPHLQSAGVAPEPGPTPLWDAFLAAVWPDEELRAWALRVLSIAVTGYSDKALPILIGEKDRGKTQVVALIMSVLGNYAHAADPRLLTSTDNAHASIVYALKGRRLSFIDEGPREGRLGQERLKQLTGGGDLTGNQMRSNPITFSPTHTLVLTANDEPVLTDPAVRSRVRLIPCSGDPEQVIAARAAIGHTSGPAWRREAPAVLAMLMREAAAWMNHRASASIEAAPEAYRYLAEEIAAEQDPVGRWLTEETEEYLQGERSRTLYEAFVGWCKNGNLHPGRIPNETKWGREVTRHGHAVIKKTSGNFRPIRLRSHGGWFAGGPDGGFGVSDGGFMEGSDANPPYPPSPANTGEIASQNDDNGGLGSSLPIYAHTQAHAGAHAHAHEDQTKTNPPPPNPPSAPTTPFSAQITASLLANRSAEPAQASPAKATPAAKATKTRAPKMDPAERAALKLAAKIEARKAKVDAAAGAQVTLPAMVTRDGLVTAIALAEVRGLFDIFGVFAEMTVDVEHSGYPVGHSLYRLRTVQLGNDQVAVVFAAEDAAQLAEVGALLADAQLLHAHSATADIVPLTHAGVVDFDTAWAKMVDTAIPALLANPQSTASDAAGLKDLAQAMLGGQSTAPAADKARGALFAAGGWLKDTEASTPLERSGWAQVPSDRETMIRYAASDVLDAGAVAKMLPAVEPEILQRERTAQRMTANVAHRGVRLDPEQVAKVRGENQRLKAEAAALVQAFGIDNPGSNAQIAARLNQLGAPLPTTASGNLSVAKGVIEPMRNLDGPVGDLVRAVLAYRRPSTALSLLLDPYHEMVTRGDGRARPTVYTLGADTGRMSCVRPNLQQVSRQGGIRACITADPGELIVGADFASVEVRVAAALSGDPNLQQMLAEGADLHGLIAAEWKGPGYAKEDRYNVKRAVFGRLYGSGIPGIAKTLAIGEEQAQQIIDVLDAMTPGLTKWSRQVRDAVQSGQTKYRSYSGRVIHLDPRLPHKAPNYLIQGTARELLVDTLVRLREGRWADVTLLPVHDEVLMFVPEAEAEQATADLVRAMETSLMGVAIEAEASAPSFAWQDAS